MFRRKAYDRLLEWKEKYGRKYAALLQGARRVGKSTIAEAFARQEFRSYILIDFSTASADLMEVFDDIGNIDLFLRRLQAVTECTLYNGESVIVFDEIQFCPKARQAIKHLVKDGRYFYIETGSLISIKKNVKDILIPSEEHRIDVLPMDYEEFMWATGKGSMDLLRQLVETGQPLGAGVNRTLMRNYRIYMAVGGMPQAVEAYVEGKNFAEIDEVKREIIELYKNDFRKIDPSGRVSALFEAIPSQLAMGRKRFGMSTVLNKRITSKDEERLFDLLDSKTVLACYDTSEPGVGLAQAKKLNSFKLYLADTGLFITLMLSLDGGFENEIYAKMLSDKLEANLGYLYENAIAQAITAAGKNLYYHSWRKKDSTHSFEIDFLLLQKNKVIPVEVKSSSVRNHKSIDAFCEKYEKVVGRRWLLSQKDIAKEAMTELWPLYLAPALFEKIYG